MIIVLGSINMDLVVRVPHLPVPGETILGGDLGTVPGGKGANQAVAAARAGASVKFFGMVGQDAFGPQLTESLAANGIDVGGIGKSPRPTGVASILVDDAAENVIAVSSGANGDVHAGLVPDAVLGASGATLLMQMEVPAPAVERILARTRGLSTVSVLNLAPVRPIDPLALEALDVLIVNQGEGQQLAANLAIEAPSEPIDLARVLAKRTGSACVMTLGRDGAVAVDGANAWRIGILPVNSVDTTGAGDAFCGALAAGLDGGLVLPDALRRAAVAGALACEGLGAQESVPTEAAVSARLGDLAPAEPC